MGDPLSEAKESSEVSNLSALIHRQSAANHNLAERVAKVGNRIKDLFSEEFQKFKGLGEQSDPSERNMKILLNLDRNDRGEDSISANDVLFGWGQTKLNTIRALGIIPLVEALTAMVTPFRLVVIPAGREIHVGVAWDAIEEPSRTYRPRGRGRGRERGRGRGRGHERGRGRGHGRGRGSGRGRKPIPLVSEKKWSEIMSEEENLAEEKEEDIKWGDTPDPIQETLKQESEQEPEQESEPEPEPEEKGPRFQQVKGSRIIGKKLAEACEKKDEEDAEGDILDAFL